ncbi:unnamed protein product, partial [Mesorhabditis belari]|uniref:Major facilitator superfamily (MFS) profile domain-containing protein n=1 Tax=Mesorhabditis belari TaxID=2138241 RepID=A0AAF3F729_9BILA
MGEIQVSPFGTRARFAMLMLVLLCLTSVWSNILTFNFAIICMGNHQQNGTNETTQDPVFTKTEQKYAISIVAVAAILANFPVLSLVNHYQIRTIFGVAGLLSAIVTLAIPPAIRAGFYYFLALRFVHGVAFAVNLPVIGAFCSKWAYYKQNGLFVAGLVAYLQVAPAFTNPVSGGICHVFGWSAIFYFHGAVGLVLFLVYGFFYRNSPGKHPFVSDVEKNKIQIGKSTTDKKALKQVPYGKIVRTPAIWAVWIASFGNFTVINMIFLYSPIYLSTVLGYSVTNTGFTAALAPLAQAIMKVVVGQLSDKIKFLSEVNKLRMFNTIAFFGCFFFLCLLAFTDPLTQVVHFKLSLIFFGCAGGIVGANTGGFFRAAPILSRQYSHFVTGNISLGISITMFLVPFFVTPMTPNNTAEEWRVVFLCLGGVMAICNVIFCIFVRGEPCEWTKEDFVITRTSVVQPTQINEPRKF